MNWKSIVKSSKELAEKTKPFLASTKKVATETAEKLSKKAEPMVKKAKGYTSDAVAYVGKQIEQTPIFIKTEAEYNEFITNKRTISIAYDSRDISSESIRLMMPIWATQAWTDAADLKYIEISSTEELVKILKIKGPLEMRVSYMEEEFGRFSTLQSIKEWWKSRDYIRSEDNIIPSN